MGSPKTDTPGSAPDLKADAHLFVRNDNLGPCTIVHPRSDGRQTILGPGLNVVEVAPWRAAGMDPENPPPGSTATPEQRAALAAAAFGGSVFAVDPLKISDRDALALVSVTASRQALKWWGRIEKRSTVTKAINDRLAARKRGKDVVRGE